MITVLLPAYNSSSYIKEAIESILNQTFRDFELLIIDDGSTDDTVSKIKTFNDGRIKMHVNETNIGIGPTLNYGLKAARFNLVARMDSDDISLPSRLEEQYKYMTQNSGVDVLSSRYAVMDNKKILYTVKTSENHRDIRKRLILHSEILHSGVMYRKNRILEYGGYKDIYIEDYELWLRLKDKVIFHNLPEVLLLMRYHDESVSMHLERKTKTVYGYTEKYFQDLQKEFGINKNDEYIFRGWREFFYGDKKESRKYFLRSFAAFIKSPRAVSAFFITFLGNAGFIKFRELRFRFRITYLLKYFSQENIRLRKFLKQVRE